MTTDTSIDEVDAPAGLAALAPLDLAIEDVHVTQDEPSEKAQKAEKARRPTRPAKANKPVHAHQPSHAAQAKEPEKIAGSPPLTPKTLSSLAPEAIPQISDSDVFAMVQMQGGVLSQVEYRRVEIPKQFQSCPIYRALLYSFKTEKSAAANPMVNYRKALRFDVLGAWASVEYPNAQHLPNAVFQDYARHLRQVRELQQNSICIYMSGYRTGLDSFLEHAHGNPALAGAAGTVREAIAFIPSVANSPAKPKDSLGQITDQEEKDEHKLVRSTIHYCCQFLKQMNEQRLELLSDPEVMRELQARLDACGSNYKELKYTTTDYQLGIGYKFIAASILESCNMQLKERLLHNDIDFSYSGIENGTSMSIEGANSRIKEGLRPTGNIDVQPEAGNARLYFHNIDYLFLIKHTPSEETAFAWLLATDRVQASGAARMRLEDLRITATTASAIYIKGRSTEPTREVPLHYKKTMQYQAYADFKSLKESFYERFPETGDALFKLPSIANFQAIDGTVYRPLLMAAYKHTAQYQAQLEHAPDSELFADILRRVAANNRQVLPASHTKDRPAFVHTGDGPSPKRQTISITAIAQSRAILDADGDSHDNEAFEKYSQEIVGADATAHSPGVKEVIYKHASQTKYRLEKRAAFATSVGQLMVEDARKVQAAIREEEVIEISALKAMLGWSEAQTDMSEMEEFDQLLFSAQQAGFTVSPFGELEKDGVSYLINNPVSAALLMSYRKECVNQIERLSAEDELKAFAIAMQAAHIDQALERFDRKTVSEGLEIFKKANFPPPVIR
ncbi:hypothetical protein BW687_002210 [Pseudomonas graminis]|uniref:hypothetical protein n=1 Tax=Pseudomonas graminis TaxID=158627 RepID=UPI002349B0C9|nr:hypothetical protein [Pseudomonas graminis]MDC6378988.1 hypothetical protein [Pseudomonas graminis]